MSLLKKNASLAIKNNEQKDALDLALEMAHVQVVTVMRLIKFDNEQKNGKQEQQNSQTSLK